LNVKFNRIKDAYIDPVHMVLKFVNGMSQQFGFALFEVRLMYRDAAQFGGAHGGKVCRMGK